MFITQKQVINSIHLSYTSKAYYQYNNLEEIIDLM